MKQLLVIIILGLTAMGCTSGNNKDNHADSTKKKAVIVDNGPFDLNTLTLKELYVPEMMKVRNVKPEPILDDEPAISSLAIFKSSNPKVLKFAGKDLSGVNGDKKNHIMLYYDDHTDALAFYEVIVYTQEQADTLLTELQKMGKPVFEKLGLGKGEIAIDLEGNPIERGKEPKQTNRVWQNKKNGLTYYLIEYNSGKDLEAELTVLNEAEKHAKDWIAFRTLDWHEKK